MLKAGWLEPVYVDEQRFRAIKCPVLLVVGDRDTNFRLERMVEMFRMLPIAQLAIVPGSGHLVLATRPQLMYETFTHLSGPDGL